MAELKDLLSSHRNVEVEYKTVHDIAISTTIWIPTSIDITRPCPVAVRWHGGGLVTGSRSTAEYFPDWIAQFITQERSILVMPDYRLLPESCGKDILADVNDFWSWSLVLGRLQEYLPPGSKPNLEGILVIGESAGGFLALQSALRSPVDIFAAMILEYPMIDLRDPHYTQDYEKPMWDPPFPQSDRKIFDDHMATLTNARGPFTNATGFERMNLAFVMSQRGLYEELLGSDPSIYPLDIMHEVDRLPPTWLIHGTGDTIVPIAATHKLVREVFKQLPDWKLHTSFMKGEHMFDKMNQRVSTKTDWVAAGISFISSSWMSTRRALS